MVALLQDPRAHGLEGIRRGPQEAPELQQTELADRVATRVDGEPRQLQEGSQAVGEV
jgi:hypothetical protein